MTAAANNSFQCLLNHLTRLKNRNVRLAIEFAANCDHDYLLGRGMSIQAPRPPELDIRAPGALVLRQSTLWMVIQIGEKLSDKLLEILCCPACKGDVRQDDDTIVCLGECGRVYPVRDGIPIMLIEEATLPEKE